MEKEKRTVEIEEITDKKEFSAWIKEHKTQILLTGISVTAILTTALGLKNKIVVEPPNLKYDFSSPLVTFLLGS